jgi:hypothetical protein
LYSNANEIITLKKHVYANHYVITKIFEEKVNNLLKKTYDKKPTKKKPHKNGTTIFLIKMLPTNIFIRKMMCNRNSFLEDLVLSISKNHLSMHHIESQWLKRFNLHLCPRVVLISRK